MESQATIKRARTPDQVETRRVQILGAARTLLANQSLDTISLRSLAAQVGLSKSNVVRYYPSREAVFLELLDDFWGDWLQELESRLKALTPSSPTIVSEVSQLLASTVLARPQFCDLLAQMTSVLERNITLEFARDIKTRVRDRQGWLARLLMGVFGSLPEDVCQRLTASLIVLLGGYWPYFTPNAIVEQVVREVYSESLLDNQATLSSGFGALIRGHLP